MNTRKKGLLKIRVFNIKKRKIKIKKKKHAKSYKQKEMKKEKWSKSTLEDLSIVMSDASICWLGQAACNPLNSILKYFPEELQLND